MQHRALFPRKNPRLRRQAGFTLVEIMIVVLVIGVLLNIALPSFIGARDKAQARSCVKNLSDFQTAKEQYAMENKIPASNTTAVTWSQISPYIKAPSGTDATYGPFCPTRGDHYNYQPLAVSPTCGYGASAANPLALHQL